MKPTLIVLIVGILAVGCGKKQSGNTNESNNTPENSAKKKVEKTTPSKENVVGTYEWKYGGNTIISVLQEKGIYKEYNSGKTDEREYKWKIGEDGEIHIDNKLDGVTVFRINPGGSLTIIANINGKRTDLPKDEQVVLKKIK